MAPPWTKEIERQYKRDWAIRNREKVIASRRKYILENIDKVRTSKKRWINKNPRYQRTYYLENRDKILLNVKGRYKANREKILNYQKKYRFLNLEEIKNRNKEWKVNNRKSVYIHVKKYDERYPEKKIARSHLHNAVFRNKIIKPKNCQSCGSIGIIHAHHSDYSRPLFVQWLCPSCHSKTHRLSK